MNSFKGTLMLIALMCTHALSMGQTHPTDDQSLMPKWLAKGFPNTVVGIGIAPYSNFKPEKSWGEAFHNAVEDLNANYSMVVNSYGYQIGRGPLRLRSNFAIRTLIDSAEVTVIDSVRWKDRAFLLMKSTKTVSDSILYPNSSRRITPNDFSSAGDSLRAQGTSARINSNWNVSFARAKQNALKKLAERLSVKVSTTTYAKKNVSRRYYSFTSMFAFQRIRISQYSIEKDSIRVQIAIQPDDVKMLMD